MLKLLISVGCGAVLAGCGSQAGPDVNTQVFETAEQARANREAKFIAGWNQTALAILQSDRPDVAATRVGAKKRV